MSRIQIIISIIIGVGGLGGIVKYFNARDTNMPFNRNEFFKYLLTGIGSAILIPLLLNMLSSDLIKSDNISDANYLIFAGFCFVAGFFSDRFIVSIGEKVISEINKTKEKLEIVKQEQQETNEKVGAILENESEPISETNIENIESSAKHIVTGQLSAGNGSIGDKDELLKEVLGTFRGGKFKFRTIDGISKELKYPAQTVEIIVNTFEQNGILTKIIGPDGRELWGLTGLGKLLKF